MFNWTTQVEEGATCGVLAYYSLSAANIIADLPMVDKWSSYE